MNTPINNGLLQSDLDCAGFDLLNFSVDGGGGSGSENVVYLSTSVTSDAADIGYGATAPTGTDVTSDVQDALDSVPAGGTLVWDVAVGLSAPILIPSDITIIVPSRKFGAILRAGANCPMFRNVGITTDATTSNQKTFGKLDPDHAGDAKYRVLDSVNYVNDRNISFIGGTWNGNSAAQTGNVFTAAYGFLSAFHFWGVENVLMRDVYVLGSKGSITVHFINAFRVRIDDLETDASPLDFSTAPGASGNLMISGPSRNIRINNPVIHSSDDPIALNADDSNGAAIDAAYGTPGSCTPGINWSQNGDITDVVVNNMVLSDGIEGVNCCGVVRLYTSVHLIDDVLFDGISGTTQLFGFNIGAHNGSGLQISGTGNLGNNVEFRNVSVELVSPINSAETGGGLFDIMGGGECLRITGRKRGTVPASGVADVRVHNPSTGSGTLKELYLEADYIDGGTVAAAQIKIESGVTRIYARTRSERANTANASPVLLTASGAVIELFDFHGDGSRVTNIVKHVAGTLGAVTVRGSHRNANGGSPVDVASGLTVTNGWHPDLAFLTANGFKSGSGTITYDNDWH